jgi:hypothetical protein
VAASRGGSRCYFIQWMLAALSVEPALMHAKQRQQQQQQHDVEEAS